jgi:uncharacterized membrane protein HdeD (DUF308 family)
MGFFQVCAAILLREEIEGEFWMALGGMVSIAFGVLLVVNRGAGLLSLVWIVGVWAVAFGITSLVLAWRLRKVHQAAARPKQAASA